MEKKELRIGNLVYYFNRALPIPIQKIIVIETITEGGVNHLFAEEGLYEKDFKDLNPIPLTPEWLEKLGFKNNRIYIPNQGWTWKIEMDNDGLGITVQDEYRLSTPIKYVHQLQNLYFALTGEELTIKALHISGE